MGVVDYARGGSFGFLGFDLREGCNRFGKRFVLRTPMRKKQSELVKRVGRILKFSRHRKLRDVLEDGGDPACHCGLGQLLSSRQRAPSV